MWTCPNCGKKCQAPGGHKQWCGKPYDAQGFWDGLMPLPWSGCWIWMKAKYSTGYGCAPWSPVRGTPGKLIGAHRIAWILAYGEPPEGMHVLHKCDEPFCCNPNHLFLGTHQDNMEDRSAKGRQTRGDKGRSKLTEEQARLILSLKGKADAALLADKYGVRNGAITNIWAGRAWKYLQQSARS